MQMHRLHRSNACSYLGEIHLEGHHSWIPRIYPGSIEKWDAVGLTDLSDPFHILGRVGNPCEKQFFTHDLHFKVCDTLFQHRSLDKFRRHLQGFPVECTEADHSAQWSGNLSDPFEIFTISICRATGLRIDILFEGLLTKWLRFNWTLLLGLLDFIYWHGWRRFSLLGWLFFFTQGRIWHHVESTVSLQYCKFVAFRADDHWYGFLE